jgi:protein-S-isoprenylcysteine O-methyltransferase Ste14
MKSRSAALAASGLWLVIAPGTVAGLLPWLITSWRVGDDFGGSSIVRGIGVAIVVVGGAALAECFWRFAWTGLAAPVPITPTRKLIATGLYRHVRNPMYFAVITMVVGEALLLGRASLLAYAFIAWIFFHMFVVAYEEPTVRTQFPADFERFARAVPRWIPRLTPWRGDDPGT